MRAATLKRGLVFGQPVQMMFEMLLRPDYQKWVGVY